MLSTDLKQSFLEQEEFLNCLGPNLLEIFNKLKERFPSLELDIYTISNLESVGDIRKELRILVGSQFIFLKFCIVEELYKSWPEGNTIRNIKIHLTVKSLFDKFLEFDNIDECINYLITENIYNIVTMGSIKSK